MRVSSLGDDPSPQSRVCRQSIPIKSRMFAHNILHKGRACFVLIKGAGISAPGSGKYATFQYLISFFFQERPSRRKRCKTEGKIVRSVATTLREFNSRIKRLCYVRFNFGFHHATHHCSLNFLKPTKHIVPTSHQTPKHPQPPFFIPLLLPHSAFSVSKSPLLTSS